MVADDDVAVDPTGVAVLLERLVHDVVDFPEPGVVFKDLTPVLADGEAFHAVTHALVDRWRTPSGEGGFDVVAGVEARGFVLGAAVAYAAGVGIVPVRKAGKLPREVHAATYALEYGEATLEVHTDAFVAGQRVLVVDDVLATGGTLEAAVRLAEQAGGTVVGVSVVLELSFLAGRDRLRGYELQSLMIV